MDNILCLLKVSTPSSHLLNTPHAEDILPSPSPPARLNSISASASRTEMLRRRSSLGSKTSLTMIRELWLFPNSCLKPQIPSFKQACVSKKQFHS